LPAERDLSYNRVKKNAEADEMADLIKLACPTCGGKLKVSKNAVSLKCQFCGNEHLVKHDVGGVVMLEAFARCPVCGRNDKSEKVSAVIASQSHEISGVEQKSEVFTTPQGQQQTIVRDVPFTRKQVSVLGQRLAAPLPPDPSRFPAFPPAPGSGGRGWGAAAILIGILGLLLACGLVIAAISSLVESLGSYAYSGALDSAIVGVALAGGGGFVGLFGLGFVSLGIMLTARARRSNSGAVQRYQEQVEAVKQEHARIQAGYERAVRRWRDLYYCARDDCVFVPGEGSSAPLAKMNEYLTSPPAPSSP
jgi:predicted RNA-binding Zn-ribbon protein involved in translation (DUF1610 family)